MLPYRNSRIASLFLIIFFIIVALYGYYEARGILFGPNITVTTPDAEVHDAFFVVEGHTERIASLAINGAATVVTENGSFSAPYLLQKGYNRITLDARDKYGTTISKTLEIIYTPASTTPTVSSDILKATSSATSTRRK